MTTIDRLSASFPRVLRHEWTLSRLALMALFYASSVTQPVVAVDSIRTVALSGMQAPGTNAGVYFSGNNLFVEGPRLTEDGRAIFSTTLTGAGVNNSNLGGIWIERHEGLSLLARYGDPVPDLPNSLFKWVATPGGSGNGQIAFLAEVVGSGITTSNNRGIWRADAENNLNSIVRTGDPTPGVDSEDAFASMSDVPNVNSNGQSAFRAYIRGPAVTEQSDGGIWSYNPDLGLKLLAREGDSPPGAPSGLVYDFFGIPTINGKGKTVFAGYIGPLGQAALNTGVFSDRSGQLESIVQTGDSAPGIAGSTVVGASEAGMNYYGQVLFHGYVSGVDINADNDSGLWLNTPNVGSTLLVRTSDQAPGVSAGVSFSVLPLGTDFYEATLNSSGQVAFISGLAGSGVDSSNALGIWAGGAGDIKLVARARDQAVGAPAGDFFASFQRVALNSRGQVAFLSYTTGGLAGIWATDSTGALKLIARTGQLMDVSDDPMHPDVRTVSALKFTSVRSSDGGAWIAGGFNNRGQIGFAADFTNGTQGFFVSNLVGVPEPTGWLHVLSGGGFTWFLVSSTRKSRKMS